MKSDDIYNNIVTSLVKWINDLRQEVFPDAEYVDFDEHAQITELPTAQLAMGPAGVGLAQDEDGWEVVFSFGVLTYQDKNLQRLRKAVSYIFGRLPVEATIPIYDAETGEELTWMVIRTPRAVTPVTKAEIRSLQFVEMSALLNPAAASSPR